jgi:hypothetical protein
VARSRLCKVGLSTQARCSNHATLTALSAPLQHLELRAYGAALTDAGAVAQLGRLRALSLDVDLSFFGASAERQVCATHASDGLQPHTPQHVAGSRVADTIH